MPIPAGWSDDGHTLTAPNKVPVVLGFRDHILQSSSWDTGNQPCEAEYHTNQVLLHNASIGAGTAQIFRDSLLWYTSARGVVEEPFLGLELDAAYKQIARLQAQLVQQPTTAPMPNVSDALSHVEAALAAAGVVATELGKAVPDLKQ